VGSTPSIGTTKHYSSSLGAGLLFFVSGGRYRVLCLGGPPAITLMQDVYGPIDLLLATPVCVQVALLGQWLGSTEHRRSSKNASGASQTEVLKGRRDNSDMGVGG
jgi:hypothetical protein